MTSYRHGEPTGLAASRLVGDTLLGTRTAVAGFAATSVPTVRRRCSPIACDVGTRAFLYDVDACVAELSAARVA